RGHVVPPCRMGCARHARPCGPRFLPGTPPFLLVLGTMYCPRGSDHRHRGPLQRDHEVLAMTFDWSAFWPLMIFAPFFLMIMFLPRRHTPFSRAQRRRAWVLGSIGCVVAAAL